MNSKNIRVGDMVKRNYIPNLLNQYHFLVLNFEKCDEDNAPVVTVLEIANFKSKYSFRICDLKKL